MAKTARNKGFEAQELGNIAENTFSDLVQIWLAGTGVNRPSRLTPDSQKIDFVVELPSLWKGMTSMRTHWQIKSSSQKFTKHRHPELDSDCFHFSFRPNDLRSLKESVLQDEHFYLAFAHNVSNAQSSALLLLPPNERFVWYCIDLSQQMIREGEENYLVIPEQNVLNLSTFSLLWSSLWVEKFYDALTSRTISEIPDLGKMIRRVYPNSKETNLSPVNWNVITNNLSKYEKEFEKKEFTKVSLSLGIGSLLENITKKLYSKSGKLDTIQTYCPESLYGTANLWLFAKSYHDFMGASGVVLEKGKAGQNLRILPLPDDPERMSKLEKVCIWHIVLLYSALKVEVRIIYCPKIDAGSDHSYYGGGIGYFPWLNISDDGLTWMIENNIDATNSRHRDFINEHMNNIFINPYRQNIFGIANSFDLHPDDLRTAPKCPKQLFAKSSSFIEYPSGIFGGAGFHFLEKVKQQIYR
ncbi:hypothetical protein [Mucilaginibacter psychrotolerans]|uniref:hypothetical protein n=1 Tax=Mucilaginibacter psychrotolerans TaxID=1524096 RepID=UPI00130546B7|nr:hypothetical protein [Mucilaginibacter psychrotolerans]